MIRSVEPSPVPGSTVQVSRIGAGGFIQIPGFATRSQCQEWEEIILRRRDAWLYRAPGAWSFGNAWYYDIELGEVHRYYANAMSTNRLMRELPGYVETMLKAVDHILDPQDQLCLATRARHQNLGPYWCEMGVHVFAAEPGRRTEVGDIHQDVEGLMPYPAMMFDERTRAYSAVLTLTTPEEHGGLNLWPRRLVASNDPLVTPEEERIQLDMQVGTMTIIDSFLPHQIQDILCSERKPWRISGVIHFLHLESPYPHWEYWF